MNMEEFKGIRESLEKEDSDREQEITLSRDLIRESKIVIYGLQRGENVSLDKIRELVSQFNVDSLTGISKTAMQEYVEALTFYYYIKENRLITMKELEVRVEDYLLGLCDLSGELVRKAVKDAIAKNYSSVLEITKFVEELYGEFLKFNLRNGELRKKSDMMRWNLQKLEQLSLDVSKA
ncbi:MAG: hypothetical protein Q8Q35_04200 [Nanoarchaeota archaeon]|nr:hypothetical protein [Nanoarchaeota archaeon]